jgi:hypothetical protein
LTRTVILLLLEPVGYQSFYPFYITGTYCHHFIIEPFRPLGPVAPQMGFAPLSPHQLAATGNMKAVLYSFVGFELWHLRFLYFLFDLYFFSGFYFFFFLGLGFLDGGG